MLRQIYSGMILATWYKHALKETLLGKVYANKAKVSGVNQKDPQANEAIYQRYLKAFKKGVFNYIKEDADKYSQQVIPRKYFAGGIQDFASIVPAQADFSPGVVVDFKKGEYISPAMLGHVDLAGVAGTGNIDSAQVTLASNHDAAMRSTIRARAAVALGLALSGAVTEKRLIGQEIQDVDKNMQISDWIKKVNDPAHNDVNIRKEAINFLKENMKGKELADLLNNVMRNDPDAEVKAHAFDALAHFTIGIQIDEMQRLRDAKQYNLDPQLQALTRLGTFLCKSLTG